MHRLSSRGGHQGGNAVQVKTDHEGFRVPPSTTPEAVYEKKCRCNDRSLADRAWLDFVDGISSVGFCIAGAVTATTINGCKHLHIRRQKHHCYAILNPGSLRITHPANIHIRKQKFEGATDYTDLTDLNPLNPRNPWLIHFVRR